MLLGTHLTLFVGPMIPVPAPYSLIENLQSIEVSNTDQERDGFQIKFSAGKKSPTDAEFDIISDGLLAPFNRIIIVITFNLTPNVLIDGIITHVQLTPGNEPGKNTLTITGEDVSVMMDVTEKSNIYPQLSDENIVKTIIATYAQYGLVANTSKPTYTNQPTASTQTPSQQHTDYQHIVKLGLLHNFVFYVEPTSIPQINTAYWGPLDRQDVPQEPLCVNSGLSTNVEPGSINFESDFRGPTFVSGIVQDSDTNQSMPIEIYTSTVSPLVTQPDWMTYPSNLRNKIIRIGGMSYADARAQAQAETDASINSVMVTGELDAFRYGNILRARKTVGLKGTGSSHDGVYYVKSVRHNIKRGEYKQSFTLTREGTGSIFPVLPST